MERGCCGYCCGYRCGCCCDTSTADAVERGRGERHSSMCVLFAFTTAYHGCMTRPAGPVGPEELFKISRDRAGPRLGRVGSGQKVVDISRVGSSRVGSGRVRCCSKYHGFGRVGSESVRYLMGRVGSGRVGSGRVGSGRVGLGRVGSDSVRNLTG